MRGSESGGEGGAYRGEAREGVSVGVGDGDGLGGDESEGGWEGEKRA